MKKAFTLVELLVVVVVIVTLMSIAFRLSGVGEGSNARNITANRMQRLENCLSGYYAAYGSYPPVALHGSRDYTLATDMHGIQKVDKDEHWSGNLKDKYEGKEIWLCVEAACRSQPIGMNYPFNKQSSKDMVETLSAMLSEQNPGNPLYQFEALCDNSIVSSKAPYWKWTDQQVFKFGVLSFLLPRYLIIMGGDNQTNNDQLFKNHESWKRNNQLPADFDSGAPYAKWEDVNSDMKDHPWKIAALPSQAASARWLPNLEKILSVIESIEVYGVQLKDPLDAGTSPLRVYSAGDSESSSQQYMTDGITCKDGWNNEFYYYSQPPHQSYRLWSAGANGKTFPPWISDEELNAMNATDRKTVQDWVTDDIVQMSN